MRRISRCINLEKRDQPGDGGKVDKAVRKLERKETKRETIGEVETVLEERESLGKGAEARTSL